MLKIYREKKYGQKELRKTKLETNSRELIQVFIAALFSFFFMLLTQNEIDGTRKETNMKTHTNQLNLVFLWPSKKDTFRKE